MGVEGQLEVLPRHQLASLVVNLEHAHVPCGSTQREKLPWWRVATHDATALIATTTTIASVNYGAFDQI